MRVAEFFLNQLGYGSEGNISFDVCIHGGGVSSEEAGRGRDGELGDDGFQFKWVLKKGGLFAGKRLELLVDPFAQAVRVAGYVGCDKAGGPLSIWFLWFVNFIQDVEVRKWTAVIFGQVTTDVGGIHWVKDVMVICDPFFKG